MDPTSAIIGPWAQYGIIGSVVIAQGVLNVVLWRWGEGKQKSIDALHEARRADVERCGDRFIDMLTKNLETQNRMADGMEAFERVVDKVKPA